MVEQNFHHLFTPPIRNIRPALKTQVRQQIFSPVNFHSRHNNERESTTNELLSAATAFGNCGACMELSNEIHCASVLFTGHEGTTSGEGAEICGGIAGQLKRQPFRSTTAGRFLTFCVCSRSGNPQRHSAIRATMCRGLFVGNPRTDRPIPINEGVK